MNKKEILGFTAGNFDLLHPGYINCFRDAKRHCDKFIIFLQKDPSLHRKSKYKPVIPLYDRYLALMSIKYIDDVYIYQTEKELYNLIKFQHTCEMRAACFSHVQITQTFFRFCVHCPSVQNLKKS